MKAKTPVTIEQDPTISKSTEVVEALSSESNNHQPKSVNAVSSQRQLLGLAKQFVLDGALLPTEKQMPLEDRANKRDRISHLRRQQNLEAIIKKTVGYCSNEEITDRADKDWFDRYLTFAENVSNPSMQELWAKILAGEISSPGSYSLKALQVFRNLSITEAKLLGKVAALAIKDTNGKNVRLISGAYQTPGLWNIWDKKRQQAVNLSQFGVNYSDLLTLAENHLLFIQETETKSLQKDEQLHFSYNGLPFNLVAKKNDCILSFYKLTPAGNELINLIANSPDQAYFNALKEQLSHHFSATFSAT